MAYASLLGGGYGATPSVIPNAHGDTVSVPDAELLFNGDFRRAGPDLVLTGHDGRHHLVPGYFSGEKKALVAPNGASLSPDLVDLLAGSPTPGQYAQAQQTTPPDAIGKVEKAVGNVTAIRNGVAVALHVGDAVFKSDIIQTGSNSSAGVGFPDGTALNLIANTRMALNDYSYDPNGTSNVALVSLVQGTFAFVAGRVAHTGDMKIETPVATMGIRGTTGWVQEVASITANLGNVSYSFAVVDDYNSTGHGQYDLIDANGNIIATVSQTGYVTYVTPQGIGQAPLVSTEPMTNSQLGFEQQIIQQVFQVLNGINNPNPNPQSTPGTPGSGTPPNQLNELPHLLQEGAGPQYAFNIPLPGAPNTNVPGTVTFSPPAQQNTQNNNPTATVSWVSTTGGDWNNPANWSDALPPTGAQNVDITLPVKVTINDMEEAASLVIGAGGTLNIIAGGELIVAGGISNAGVLQLNSSGGDPQLVIDGTVDLLDGGTIEFKGPAAQNLVTGLAGSSATLVNVDNTIEGSGIIGQGDGALTLVNGSLATIDAVPLVAGDSGVVTIDTGNTVSNSGLLEATVSAFGAGTLAIDDAFNNHSLGVIAADGVGASVVIDNNSPEAGDTLPANADVNSGTIEAVSGGKVTIEDTTIVNSSTDAFGNIDDGQIVAGARSHIYLDNATILQGFVTVAAGGEIDTVAGSSNTIDTANGPNHNISVPTITIDGTVVVNDNSSLTLASPDAIDNAGTIELNSTGDATTLYFDQPFAGINGGGHIVLSDNAHNTIAVTAAGDQVTNFDNTISGAGTIGSGGMVLVNQGTIDANDSHPLTLDPTSLTNGGVLEATSGATLVISDTTVADTDGAITVAAGSTLDLDVATIVGGPITDNGLIDVTGSSEISGDAVLTGGHVAVESGQALTLADAMISGATITNKGTIDAIEDSPGNIVLSGDTVHNSGTIETTGNWTPAGFGLTLANTTIFNSSTNASGAIIDGIIETSDSTGILLDNATILGGFVSNAVAGGIATVSGTANEIDTANGPTHNTNLPTITNDGSIAVANNSSLTLVSPYAIVNDGHIELGSSGDKTYLYFSQPSAVLSGYGFILMDGLPSPQDIIAGITGQGFTTVNLDNQGNTISGAGAIGQNDGALTFTNDAFGIINADLSGQTLYVETGHTFTNNALIAATNGGILDVVDNVGGSGNVAIAGGGLAEFAGTFNQDVTFSGAGTLDLAQVYGGTVTGFGAGDGIDLTNLVYSSNEHAVWTQGTGTLTIYNGVTAEETIDLAGSYVQGNFKLEDVAGKTEVVYQTATPPPTSAAWTGGGGDGSWSNANNWNNGVPASTTNAVIDLAGTYTVTIAGIIDAANSLAIGDSGNHGATLSGSGTLTVGSIVNYGTVQADQGDNLTINEIGNGSLNYGTIEATDGGSLTLDREGSVANEQNGIIEALDHGSTLTLNNNLSDANYGTIKAAGGGEVDLNVADTDPGNIIGGNYGTMQALSGGIINIVGDMNNALSGSVVEAVGHDSEVTVIGSSHYFTVLTNDGALLAAQGGDISISDDTIYNSGSITAKSGGTVELGTADAGVVMHNDLSSSLVEATEGGHIVSYLEDYSRNFGTVEADKGGTITDNIVTGDVYNFGTVEAVTGGTYTLDTAHEVVDDGNPGGNYGVMLAASGGTINIIGGLGVLSGQIGGTGPTYHGLVVADAGGTINIGTTDSPGFLYTAEGAAVKADGGTIVADLGNGLNGVFASWNDGANIVTDEGSFTVNIYSSETGNGGFIGAFDGGTYTLNLTNEENDGGPGVGNYGKMKAGDGGTIDIFGRGLYNGSNGTIEANGFDASVNFSETSIGNDGTIAAKNHGIVSLDDSAISGGGTLEADGGTIFVSSDSTLTGPISVSISGGGIADFADVVNANAAVTVAFSGPGTLALEQPPSTDGDAPLVKLSGFGNYSNGGDTLDLKNLTYDQGVENVEVHTGDIITLVVTDGASSETFQLDSYHGDNFTLVSDPWGGTDVVYGNKVSWSSGSDGYWNDAANWNDGYGPAPGEYDTAVVVTSGTYVTVDDGETVGNLVVGNGEEGGQLDVVASGSLTVLNALDDYGSIAIDGTEATASFAVDGPVRVESGGSITSHGGAATVDFSNDQVGNAGDISADCGGVVKFDGASVWNLGSGTIEAKWGGIVDITHSTIDQSSDGLIEAAGSGSAINLDHATIIGGTLETDCGGVIQTVCGNSTLDNVAITCGSDVVVNDGTSLTLEQTIDNHGLITIGSSEGDADLVIDNCVTLRGHGDIVLSGGGDDNIVGGATGGTLYNVNNTISGGGTIGGCDLTLVNESCGVIDATQQFSALTLDTGSNAIHNSGLLEATTYGDLAIQSFVDNACGTVEAASGGYVQIEGGISGGEAVIAAATLELDGCANIAATFSSGQQGALVLGAESHFTGSVSGFAAGDAIDLQGIDYSGAQLAYSSTNNTVTVQDGVDGPSQTIQLEGTGYSQSSFALFDDGTGHVAITVLQASPAQGTQYGDSGNYFQYVSDSTATWLIAQAGAVSAGGFLATINSADENAFILGLTGGQTAWLGGSDQESSNPDHATNWYWVSGPDAGQPFTYTNWHQGEPNDIDHPPYDIGEHFLQFRSDGTWNDEQGPIVESGAMTDGYVIETTPLTSDPTVVPGTSDVEGYIAFTDPNSGDALTAAATPEGSNYIGTFVLDPVSKSGDTATLDFQFNLASDQINLAPGETLTQSYEVSVANGQNTLVNQSVSVTIGGPGNDNFVFAPGIGTDTIVNFNAQADTIDLSHFANIQSLQQVAAAITSDVHGDAVIELGHNDSITLPGVTANYLQQHLQSVVHVHA
jgi:hypothetical protein